MAKRFLPFLIVAGFFLLIALLDSPLTRGLGVDREVFRYVGFLMREGGMPYADVFDHKPPLIYFIAWATDFMGFWGLWLGCNLLDFAAVCVLFFSAKRIGAWQAVLISSAWILFQRNPDIYEEGLLTRQLSSSLILMVACLHFLDIRENLRWLLAGLGTSLVFLAQQNDMLGLAPWLFYALFIGGKDHFDLKIISRNIFLFVLAFCVPLLLVSIWLLAHSAFDDMIQVGFVYNFKYYIPEGSLLSRMKGVFLHFVNRNLLYRLIALCIPVFFLITKDTSKKPAPWILTSLAAGCFSVSLSGNFFGHYFLPLMPWFALLLFVVLDDWRHLYPNRSVVLSLAFVFALSGDLMVHFRYLGLLKKGDNLKFPEWTSVLDEVRGKKGAFFSYQSPDNLALNVHYRITSPSFYVYQHIWEPRYTKWDREGKEFGRMLDQVDKARTKYILDESSSHHGIRPELESRWRTFVTERYDTLFAVPENKGYMLILKGQPKP